MARTDAGTLRGSPDDENWAEKPWRCIRMLPDMGLVAQNGMPFLRVHDLDLHNRRQQAVDEYGKRERRYGATAGTR